MTSNTCSSRFSVYVENMRQTCFEVAVARAKITKLAAVNEDERYELKVVRSEEPSSLERKYGVAVIITVHASKSGQSYFRVTRQYRSMAIAQYSP